MLTYLIRRILLMPPTLVGMTAIVFLALAMAPGGIGASLLSRTGEMRPEERRVREAYLNQRYGLDKPKPVQYARWLNKVSPVRLPTYTADDPAVVAATAEAAAQTTQQGKPVLPNVRPGDFKLGLPYLAVPDLGDSFVRTRRSAALIFEALPQTLLLQSIAVPLSYALAVWLGIQQATRRGSLIDYGASGFTLALWAIPSIWVGVLLIGYLANDQYLRWFPTTGLHSIGEASMQFLPTWEGGTFQRGWLLDTAWHLVLPLICLTYGNFAFLSRLARGALLDNLHADYVRTARAKGLPPGVVLYRHAFRTSLIPLITVAANILPAVIAGSVIVESIFGIPGMGRLAVEAAQQRDFELLLSITLVTAFLQLLGYLLADIGYAIADPRVSYA